MGIAIPKQDVVIGTHTYRIDKGGKFYLQTAFGWIDERTIDFTERPWRPFVETMPYGPDGRPNADTLDANETFWANSHFLVHKRIFLSDEGDGSLAGAHLSMRTVENDVRHDWREMQRVKNELLGEDWEAVELYPSEKRVVDMANQFHLWGFPFEIPVGFPTKGPVRMTMAEAARTGAKQRERSA